MPICLLLLCQLLLYEQSDKKNRREPPTLSLHATFSPSARQHSRRLLCSFISFAEFGEPPARGTRPTAPPFPPTRLRARALLISLCRGPYPPRRQRRLHAPQGGHLGREARPDRRPVQAGEFHHPPCPELTTVQTMIYGSRIYAQEKMVSDEGPGGSVLNNASRRINRKSARLMRRRDAPGGQPVRGVAAVVLVPHA
ncbi:hypothetical protein VPH35_023147 [Triticum aestivum]